MANKNFVVKHGLEVNTNLIFADKDANKVGIGTTIVNSTLDVNGSIKSTSLSISGVGTIPTLYSNTSHIGFSTISNLYVSGVSTFSSNLDINSSVDIQNGLSVTGVTTLGFSSITNLHATGVSTFSSDLDINSSVDIQNGLSVTGVTTLGFSSISNLYVSGVSTFSSNLDINSSVDIQNGLSVTGVTTLGFSTISNLYVSGVSTVGNFRITPIGSGATVGNNGVGVVTYYGDGSQLLNVGASNITVTATPSDTTTYPLFVANSTTGSQSVFVDSGISWNATNNIFSLPRIDLTTGINLTDLSYIHLGSSDDARIFYDGVTNDLEIELESTANKIAITDNGTYKHLITRDGKIGINTSITPTLELVVNGNSNIGNFLVTKVGSGATVGGSNVTYYGDASQLSNIPPGSPSGSNNQVQYNSSGSFAGSANLTFNGTSLVVGTAVTINSSGINAGSTGIITAKDFNSLSDIRYKENVNTINGALLKVDQLRGVKFEWKESGSSSYGIIAQELEEVLPELVSGDNPKTVNYNGIIGVLIEAIKELKDEISDLKEQINK